MITRHFDSLYVSVRFFFSKIYLKKAVTLFGLIYCSQAGFYYLELVDTFNSNLTFFAFIFIELYFFISALSIVNLLNIFGLFNKYKWYKILTYWPNL